MKKRSSTKSKEPSEIWQHESVNEVIFYIAFYNNIVASGFNNFEGHFI